MKITEKLVSKVVQGITFAEELGWPPVCNGLFYQPERPVQRYVESSPSETCSEQNEVVK